MVAKQIQYLKTDIEDSDQTGKMHSLIKVLLGAHATLFGCGAR